jgi:hypothetical protein
MRVEAKISAESGAAIEAELTAFLRGQFGTEPTRTEAAPAQPVRDAGLTIAVISLLVSLPGATLETMQLAQKLKLRQRIEALIHKLRTLAPTNRDAILLQAEGQKTLDLKTATPDQVLDRLRGT